MGIARQARISSWFTETFGEGFRERWELAPYHDRDAPCVFFGLFLPEDFRAWKEHRGEAIAMFGGGDQGGDLNAAGLAASLRPGRSLAVCPGPTECGIIRSAGFRVLSVPNIPVKRFQQIALPLGDKVYVYLGFKHGKDKEARHNWHTVSRLVDTLGDDKVIWTTETLGFEELRDTLYTDAACYLKTSETGGSVTMWDLAHLGRRTVSMYPCDYTHATHCGTFDEICHALRGELAKVGTKQQNVIDCAFGEMHQSRNWLDTVNYG
jgi:hypothetical protein